MLTGRSLEWLGQKAKDSSVSITETGVRIKQSAIILSEAAKPKLEPAMLALTTTMNQFNLGAEKLNPATEGEDLKNQSGEL